MMTYENILDTVKEIIDNKLIYKEGLTLTYKLSESNHKKLDEHLFIKSNGVGKFEHRDIIDIEIGGINITLIK